MGSAHLARVVRRTTESFLSSERPDERLFADFVLDAFENHAEQHPRSDPDEWLALHERRGPASEFGLTDDQIMDAFATKVVIAVWAALSSFTGDLQKMGESPERVTEVVGDIGSRFGIGQGASERLGAELLAVLASDLSEQAGDSPSTPDGVGARRMPGRVRAEDLDKVKALKAAAEEERNRERKDEFTEIIGKSDAAMCLVSDIEKLRGATSTALITGESGTGKELVASAIHRVSARSARAFITVNLAGYPEAQVEDQLFGHKKGAFTDANEDRPGMFEEADRGTLFLDEVGDLSARTQTRLLRVLQTGDCQRMGDNRVRTVDVRVLSATNADLQERVESGAFRQDLFYRLAVVTIHVPPLRERKTDIPLLAERFLARLRKDSGKTVGDLSESALDKLLVYWWPGNIRELENTIERAAVAAGEREIRPAGITFTPVGASKGSDSRSDWERERSRILQVLNASGNMEEAAEKLGMSRTTLYNECRVHDIPKPSSQLRN